MSGFRPRKSWAGRWSSAVRIQKPERAGIFKENLMFLAYFAHPLPKIAGITKKGSCELDKHRNNMESHQHHPIGWMQCGKLLRGIVRVILGEFPHLQCKAAKLGNQAKWQQVDVKMKANLECQTSCRHLFAHPLLIHEFIRNCKRPDGKKWPEDLLVDQSFDVVMATKQSQCESYKFDLNFATLKDPDGWNNSMTF